MKRNRRAGVEDPCAAFVPGPARVALVPMHCSALRADRPPQASDQHRDVGPLSAAVGVQLIEDQKGQVGRAGDQRRPFPGPGQHRLQHHVVGEQDVGRVA